VAAACFAVSLAATHAVVRRHLSACMSVGCACVLLLLRVAAAAGALDLVRAPRATGRSSSWAGCTWSTWARSPSFAPTPSTSTRASTASKRAR
jgi:hypothetical protein